MKPWVRYVGLVVLSFMVMFIGVGYAALTDTLRVSGTAKVNIPDGLFIISTELSSSSNIDKQTASELEYTTTVNCTLSRQGSSAGTATYKITVLNNTDRTYAYRGLYYQSSLTGYNGNQYIHTSNGNNYIGVTTSFPNGSVVEAGRTLEFYVTYNVGRRLSAGTDWKTLINYQFGINVNSITEAKEAVVSKFEDILNSPTTYATLCDKIDDKFNGAEWTSNYIGNVTSSTSADSTTVNTLFAGHLQMVINGVENPITVLIKHENIDNNTKTGDDYTAKSGSAVFNGYGCEFTMYMTTSSLSQTGGSATVYAAVFTCDRDENGVLGNWYMIGEYYEGVANIVGYEGGASNGSFDTGTWRSVNMTYTPSDSYSYTVTNGNTIQTITQTVDPNAAAALKTLLSRAKTILNENDYAGTGMVALESAYYGNSGLYTVSDDGTITVDDTATRVKLIPAIKQLELALEPFEQLE